MQQDSEILIVNDEEKLQAHKNNVCSIAGNVNFRTNKDTIKLTENSPDYKTCLHEKNIL